MYRVCSTFFFFVWGSTCMCACVLSLCKWPLFFLCVRLVVLWASLGLSFGGAIYDATGGGAKNENKNKAAALAQKGKEEE